MIQIIRRLNIDSILIFSWKLDRCNICVFISTAYSPLAYGISRVFGDSWCNCNHTVFGCKIKFLNSYCCGNGLFRKILSVSRTCILFSFVIWNCNNWSSRVRREFINCFCFITCLILGTNGNNVVSVFQNRYWFRYRTAVITCFKWLWNLKIFCRMCFSVKVGNWNWCSLIIEIIFNNFNRYSWICIKILNSFNRIVDNRSRIRFKRYSRSRLIDNYTVLTCMLAYIAGNILCNSNNAIGIFVNFKGYGFLYFSWRKLFYTSISILILKQYLWIFYDLIKRYFLDSWICCFCFGYFVICSNRNLDRFPWENPIDKLIPLLSFI